MVLERLWGDITDDIDNNGAVCSVTRHAREKEMKQIIALADYAPMI